MATHNHERFLFLAALTCPELRTGFRLPLYEKLRTATDAVHIQAAMSDILLSFGFANPADADLATLAADVDFVKAIRKVMSTTIFTTVYSGSQCDSKLGNMLTSARMMDGMAP